MLWHEREADLKIASVRIVARNSISNEGKSNVNLLLYPLNIFPYCLTMFVITRNLLDTTHDGRAVLLATNKIDCKSVWVICVLVLVETASAFGRERLKWKAILIQYLVFVVKQMIATSFTFKTETDEGTSEMASAPGVQIITCLTCQCLVWFKPWKASICPQIRHPF